MADRGTGVDNQIKELKVSGHTMALEPGLYVVYNAPGGPAPDQAGLPGVRITAAPGAQTGQIEVTGFGADGWIGSDSAALVRVDGARGELMVTVYQAKDSQVEAPKLQVVLLAPAAGSAPAQAQAQAPAPQPAAPQADQPIEVVAHVYGRGDLAGTFGAWMGEPGSQRWIEGFGVAAPEGIEPGDIEYQAVLGRGWLSPWSESGQFCGSRGMSLPILGMRVRLRGEAAKTRKLMLQASFVDGTRIGPVGDGEPCEAPSLAALEAFQITLDPIAPKASGRGTPARAEPVAAPATKGKRAAKAAVQPVVEAKPARKPRQAAAVPAEPAVAKPGRKAKQAAAPVAVEPPAPVRPAPRAAAKRKPATTRRR